MKLIGKVVQLAVAVGHDNFAVCCVFFEGFIEMFYLMRSLWDMKFLQWQAIESIGEK